MPDMGSYWVTDPLWRSTMDGPCYGLQTPCDSLQSGHGRLSTANQNLIVNDYYCIHQFAMQFPQQGLVYDYRLEDGGASSTEDEEEEEQKSAEVN